jgi:mono/diheme cytochrome c family protein
MEPYMVVAQKLLTASRAVVFAMALPCAATAAGAADVQSIERGRYLVKITGCNDCHTPGYAQRGGDVPESQWLIGDRLGHKGPWGTTYPTNLRLYLKPLSEDQWVQKARTLQTRPPMPWFAVREIADDDLRAMYRFMSQLGPAGKPAPPFVPPGREVNPPFVQWPR